MNRAGARKLVLTPAIRAPHLRQKTQYGNSPQQKLDCHEGELPTLRQTSAAPIKADRFLSVFAPVLLRSWPTPLLSPTTEIESSGKRVGNPSQADGQERL
jgi:hypothetical protein